MTKAELRDRDKVDALLKLHGQKKALEEVASRVREAKVQALAAVNTLRGAIEDTGAEDRALACSEVVYLIERCDRATRYVQRLRASVLKKMSRFKKG